MSNTSPDEPEVERNNFRTWEFREQFDKLPETVRQQATKAYELFKKDPNHPSFRKHKLKDNRKGSHKPQTIAVSVNMQYRALYYESKEGNIWYWIGTHAEYDRFTGV